MNEQPFALFAAKTILLAGAAWATFAIITWVVMELIHFLQ